MVQLRGNCQPRKKKVLYRFNFEIRVSWSLNLLLVYRVPHRMMPILLPWGLWDSLPVSSLLRESSVVTAELPQAPMVYSLEGWVTDGQGASFFFLERKSSCPFRVWATSVGGALLGWRLALPRGKAACHCLGEKQTPPRGWEFRWVWFKFLLYHFLIVWPLAR